MKTLIKLMTWIIGISILIFILAAGGFWLFLNSIPDLCGNQVIEKIEINNTELNAVIFQRDCDATTGFSTQVSLINKNETLPNESGNIFIADTDHGNAPRGEGGGPEVKVKSISSNHIQILTHQNARIFKNEEKWKTITIIYSKSPKANK